MPDMPSLPRLPKGPILLSRAESRDGASLERRFAHYGYDSPCGPHDLRGLRESQAICDARRTRGISPGRYRPHIGAYEKGEGRKKEASFQTPGRRFSPLAQRIALRRLDPSGCERSIGKEGDGHDRRTVSASDRWQFRNFRLSLHRFMPCAWPSRCQAHSRSVRSWTSRHLGCPDGRGAVGRVSPTADSR